MNMATIRMIVAITRLLNGVLLSLEVGAYSVRRLLRTLYAHVRFGVKGAR